MQPITIVWNGQISGNTSFGIAGIEQCLAFDRLGCNVVISPIGVIEKTEPIPNKIKDFINKRYVGWSYSDSVFIHQGFPHFFGVCRNQPCRIKTAIGVNDSDTVMGGETINQSCDFVFGASDWVTEAYAKGGVTVPRYTLAYGINPDIWQYAERPRRRDKFRFFCCGDHTGRKRFEELGCAFRTEFGADEPVELVYKCWGTQENAKNLALMFADNSNIKVIFSEISIRELTQYYYDADCFIIATSGDAVCMPILEAMATGLPVITTNKGGQTQWTLPEFSYLIDSVEYKSPYLNGNQYMPDWQHCRKLMRYAFNNMDEVRLNGKLASEFMHKNYTWEMGVKKGLDIIRQYL